MYIIMKPGVGSKRVSEVCKQVQASGLKPRVIHGKEHNVVTCIGTVDVDRALLVEHFKTLDGVQDAKLISSPFKLTARETHVGEYAIKVDGREIGGNKLFVVAGPCSVESREMILETAQFLQSQGVSALRGGAFKPRTSPHSFQGLGQQALAFLAQASAQSGLSVVTEAMEKAEVDQVKKYADVVQIGARNMQNYRLLTYVGKSKMACLLKRGPGSTINHMLQAAEYLLNEGNHKVILCPRGVIGFDDEFSRNFSDIDAIAILKRKTFLPVIFDPSHATGERSLVIPMARAAIAAGADGLIVEVHPDPKKAKSDPAQQLNFDEFAHLMAEVHKVAEAVGRTV